MKKQNILVIGGTGTVGSELVRILKSEGHHLRTTTSQKEKVDTGRVFVNLLTGEGVRDAFEGIDRAFFLSPAGIADQHKILSPLIQEAKRRGLAKVVLMSAMGANAVETSPLRRAEIELERSGIAYNIIRPNWFLQNFGSFWLKSILSEEKILLPAGDAPVSFIDARDISAVAAKLLTSDEHNNQAFDLTGSEAIDHAGVAKVLSAVSGRKIQYVEIAPAVFKQGLLTAGLPEDYSDFLVMIFGALKAGYSAPVTKHVQTITGRAPIRVEQYARDFKQTWMKTA